MNVEYQGCVLGKMISGTLFNLSPETSDSEIVQILEEMGVVGVTIISKTRR